MPVVPKAATVWASFKIVTGSDPDRSGHAAHVVQSDRFNLQDSLKFQRDQRLHTALEFSRVFAARRVLRGRFFDLHYRIDALTGEGDVPWVVRDAPAQPRLGLIVAKKLAKRAVQRNLLKRLAREAFRHLQQRLPGGDFVLRLAKPPGGLGDAVLRLAWREDMDTLLNRLLNLQNQR